MAFHSTLLQTLDGDADQPSCSIWYIQMRLGRKDYGIGRMATYLNAMIADHGFPKPFPHMRAGTLIDAVTPQSRWQRAAVDNWLFDFLPPDAASAADAAARASAAAEMDVSASNLRLVRGAAV